MTEPLTEARAILIERGEVFAPEPLGRRDVLAVGGTIVRVGDVDRRGLDLLAIPYDVVDASDAYVVPGLIDPHQHLLGGSGEGGLALQTPMLFLSELVRDAHVGGLLTGKAGLTHFHVGEEDTRLQPLRDIVERFRVRPEWLYPTHVQRDERLLDEAIALARRGAQLDFDVVEGDLARWFGYYRDHGGPLDRLTVSSDADSSTSDIWYAQLRGLVVRHGVPLETMLRLVTSNAARILGLRDKGAVAEGADADLVVLQRGSLEIREVVARGRRMVIGGQPAVSERFLEKSSRSYALIGRKQPPGAD